MARRQPSRMTPTDRRAHILEAALRLSETRPVSELGIAEVASAASVSPGLLFHYFGSKNGVREAILRTGSAAVLELMRPDPALPLGGQLRHCITVFLDAVEQYPSGYPEIMRLAAAGDEAMRRLYEEVRETVDGWIYDALARAGIAMRPIAAVGMRGCQAFMDEAMLAWLTHPEIDRQTVVELCMSCCLGTMRFAADGPDAEAKLVEEFSR